MLRLFGFSAEKAKDAPATLTVGGRTLAITFRRHQKARRFILRLGRDGQSAVVTMPTRAARAEALAFAERSSFWIAGQLVKQKTPHHIAHEAEILFRGELHRIIASGGRRGLVVHDAVARTLAVPGDEAHLARRLTDWLKAEAKRDLTQASGRYATAMATRYRRISLRDQKSRWGSCAADGSLSYSWRLILAPPMVLDYVAAHEVAHLREMNHGPRFWRLVLSHCPEARAAKQWLKRHGHELHRLQVKASPQG